ncbi:MAG: ABC transporter permease [Candidatus Melainabacteria bacterium]|nr:ABC transporter permease [Candidatus Melainabacteria bacterium]
MSQLNPTTPSSTVEKPQPATMAGTFAQLWQKLRQDKIAGAAVLVLVLLYLAVGFADFLAPYGKHWDRRDVANAPPSAIYMIDGKTGQWTWPYVLGSKKTFDRNRYQYVFTPDTEKPYPIEFFCQGTPYRLFGLIPSNVHLFGVASPGWVALLGLDMHGRDHFSRLLFGGRISLTIGFLSLFIAFPLGLLYGGISGYWGGWIDTAMMRVAEVLMSIPTLYLLISMAAILPANMPSTLRFALVVAILAFVGWAGLSRVVRGMVLSIKNQEFVEAARALGMADAWIVIRHVLPQTASYVIVAMTIGVPGYILAESGLSFLGLGIQQPDASWGNMLKDAQDINNLITRPWMLAPGFLIFVAVLAFNVVGDAVRDVLDPKSYFKPGKPS